MASGGRDQGFLRQFTVALGNFVQQPRIGKAIAETPLLVIQERLFVAGAAATPCA